MTKLFPLLTFLLIAATAAARGQTNAPPVTSNVPNVPDQADMADPVSTAECMKVINDFFDEVKVGDYHVASHHLIDTNPRTQYRIGLQENIEHSVGDASEHAGHFQVFKPVVVREIGDSVMLIYGIAFYDRHPLRFEFIFLRPNNAWEFQNVYVTDNFVSELENIAGVYGTSSPSPIPPTNSVNQPANPSNPLPPSP
jgi:hypothetical protein